ncbi:hypothetical protein EZL74_11910 [Flavobacterium silvisoli]|uniref:Molybdopterin-synthase adenylyltransferase n=1 Tax=Flavobacterium silvisoli TaxID=2529433 RepID=A0A4Q9YW69_9FLAO|nr:HesA/MoeB/ThiF family protein [Flavobacterium silvisoli]TBX65577.1 hypothetical protein EZL74_11910 [Flavobacterium silvisoli]
MVYSKRYDKQIRLTEIGLSGQEKLGKAKVLVIGAGGLGCPVLQNLVAAGVGCVGIADGDVVEETNLHRQLLYTKDDCGSNKAVVAAESLLRQNPEVQVIPYACFFTQNTARELVSDYHILVDCTDNLAARYLINDAALALNIPMVYASIHKFEGQLSVFNYENGPSYRCLFPEKDRLVQVDTCADLGVLGVLPNILGAMQANEVLKIVLGIGTVLSSKLMLYHGLNNSIQIIDFQKNEFEISKGKQQGFNLLNSKPSAEVNSITTTEFLNALSDENNLVVDVRESYEEPKLTTGNYKSVPLAQLESFVIKYHKNTRILLFCQNGTRSRLAAEYLSKQGFTQVSHLQNGIEALEKTTY